MNFLANKPFVFISDRYEEWLGGRCISQGSINAKITVRTKESILNFAVEGADYLRMNKQVSFVFITDAGPSVDLGTRLQYLNPFFVQEDPLEVLVCHVFYEKGTISYIRFGMSCPDRIIEFYGKTVEFNGMARPEIVPGRRMASLKNQISDKIASQYRLLLKGNTVTLAHIDHQMACVACSLKTYLTLVAMPEDPEGLLKEQAFKDVSSFISTFYPIFGVDSQNVARNWFYQLTENPQLADVFLEYYDGQLKAGNPIDGWLIQNKLGLE